MVHADGARLQADQQLLALGSAHQLQVQGVAAQEVDEAGWQLAAWIVKVTAKFSGKWDISHLGVLHGVPGVPGAGTSCWGRVCGPRTSARGSPARSARWRGARRAAARAAPPRGRTGDPGDNTCVKLSFDLI